MNSDSGSRAERQDRNGLGPEDGRTAPVEGHRPTSGATQEIVNRLKECPFCGGDAVLEDLGDPNDDSFVHCSKCEVQQIARYNPERAVEAWNTRSTLTNLTPSGVERIIDLDRNFWNTLVKAAAQPHRPSSASQSERVSRLEEAGEVLKRINHVLSFGGSVEIGTDLACRISEVVSALNQGADDGQ